MNSRLRIAIQKKGRLAQQSLSLLKRAGIQFIQKNNSLLVHVNNFPIDLLLVRDDDIPTLVVDGLCDAGIVGENVLLEANLKSNITQYQNILSLASCYCRLAIAVPKEFDYCGLDSLSGKRIATSYPFILKRYLRQNNIDAECLLLSGCVEVAPRMGMADAICDLVSSGQTLEENKLIEVETVLNSQATFVKTNHQLNTEKQLLLDILARRFQAVIHASARKYILFHTPRNSLEAICKQLPGAESPTILALPNQPDKVAVHVVSSEEIFWDTLEKIQVLGASSILVLPIEKMLE